MAQLYSIDKESFQQLDFSINKTINLNKHLIPYTKFDSKRDPNAKRKTIKLLEENIGEICT